MGQSVLTEQGMQKLALLTAYRDKFLANEERKTNQRRELVMNGKALALLIDVVYELADSVNTSMQSAKPEEKPIIIAP